ncbi:uncharacterized protein LOC129592819 [Paramacrobiotus metropolitanus]|uniref:uncharacterized protein LOC129592819 n=1 Tax=Paramacrobiotus metropolitanus TaxID=2943436 RepID=UPI0024461446|nr:uncharacterized protein LOC129592819 [Paramacrobiotus metropolitanus]
MNASSNYTVSNKPLGAGTTTLTAWFIVTTFIEFLTSLSIILLIIAILYRHWRPSESHIQIIHMLLTSLLITAVVNPAMTLSIYFPSVTLSLTNCRNLYVAYIICAGSEQWASFMLSINRLIAVVFPYHYSKFNNRVVTVAAMLIGWVILLAFALPMVVGSGWDTALVPPWNICVFRPTTQANWEIFRISGIVGAYLPITGTLFCYLIILLSQLRLKRSKHRHRDPAEQSMHLKMKRRILIGKMLFASSLWYLACYLPHIVITTYHFYIYVRNPHLQMWMRALYYSGYLGTPVIFFLIGKEYRMGVKGCFHRLLRRGNALFLLQPAQRKQKGCRIRKTFKNCEQKWYIICTTTPSI